MFLCIVAGLMAGFLPIFPVMVAAPALYAFVICALVAWGLLLCCMEGWITGRIVPRGFWGLFLCVSQSAFAGRVWMLTQLSYIQPVNAPTHVRFQGGTSWAHPPLVMRRVARLWVLLSRPVCLALQRRW